IQLDVATSGGGGLGKYTDLCLIVEIVGIAEGYVEGGMFGDLSFMCPEFLQS
ncbi:hypothetical protein MKW98_028756, partial [Papaver atlanticum]